MATEKQIAANRKNAKKGGRKPGTVNQATIDRRASLKAFQQKAMAAADVLFNNQMHHATGHTYLYKIEKKVTLDKKTGTKRIDPQKPKRVTDTWEIEAYLMQQIEGGDITDPEDTYYYITTEKGDNKALDSLLDRAYGKSTNVVATEDEEGNRKEIQGNAITFADQDDKD